MEFNEYLEKIKNFHRILLEYLDENSRDEERYEALLILIKDLQIRESKYELENFFHLIVNITNNFYRNSVFLNKIRQLVLLFKDEIKQNFTNFKIFKIFKSCKLLLLFLYEEKLFVFDQSIVNYIKQNELNLFIFYFYPELKEFIDINYDIIKEETQNKIEFFNEMRKTGENDNKEINKFIRNDLIEEFIIYVNKNILSLSTQINPSIFESHIFLMSKKISMIEYAAFFGSLQIFKYLYLNHCELKPNLWAYAVYGRHPEIFQILIDNKVSPLMYGYEKIIEESIKSHHIEITDYLINNYSQFDIEKNNEIMSLIIKSRNYSFLNSSIYIPILFFNLCKYNYVKIVDLLLKEKEIDVNSLIVIGGIF